MGRKNPADAQTQSLAAQNRAQSDSYYNTVNSRLPQAAQRSDALYQTILDRANSAGGSGPGESYGVFGSMTGPGGGIDPSRLASVDEDIGGYKKIAADGGWSPQDIANSKLQASRVPTSIFAGLKRQNDQSRAITGGYAPGAGVGDARNARESARAAADATLNSDINIAESQRSGKLAGLAGASGAEMGLINAISGNQRAGASGMLSGESLAQNADQQGLQSLMQLFGSSPGELESLLGDSLQGRQLDYGTQGNVIQRGDAQDNARRDRKMRTAQMLASSGTTLATAGAGRA